ncbi:GDSL-type esterase/lipase family protein [Amycolatopsis sp. NEAU-NG30]|uniref:GDSL-type esterase/lipase family protein n=1 Tax=Amycolatopsis melonis TaxID=3156488 RepID=A0ABV0LSV2_9PSEU
MRLSRMIAVFAFSLFLSGSVTAQAATPERNGPHPVTLAESALQGVHGTAPDTTVRNVLTVTAGGTALRVRLGNPYGRTALSVRSVWVGVQAAPGSAALVPGSNRRATFGFRPEVTVPAGATVWSDPLPLTVRPGDHVAVSVYAPGAPVNDHTFPPPATDTPGSFRSGPGDAGADSGGSAYGAFAAGTLWWVDAVSAISPARGTIAALGDSITDGTNAYGGGRRWTDVLAKRLQQLPPGRQLSVANAGISGNTVSVEPNPYDASGQCCGAPAPERLERDVLSLPGLRYVLLLEGTNDLGGGDYAPPAPASQVIDAMRGIIARVHAAGHRIVGATILPMCNAAGSAKEAARLAVNAWIRTSGAFDAVLDFDSVLRDPADPTVIPPALRTDCYHPNAEGDRLLGESIDLSVFGR